MIRNDASFAYHNAFESTFSDWNTFLENRADSSDYGFWLGYSRANTVEQNSIVGSRSGGDRHRARRRERADRQHHHRRAGRDPALHPARRR